ncbi:GntP family permease [Flavilitoribacter nigricans]|uniref:Gluconate transporter n=1 Tax=Flavilitoribacter nigricans (strain ATCC 23147 / DSM 23189 / NBRC 102662 / NCIMB 1420 / SS-2) TaxID=1122177 RepID=A0A2D0N509_FLAN2|nr:SLC13 family permease [Flavilitoribacter nigricans]PHN03585.1 gluconate transporter [Flavilitoribacter nigricans DSM 23189 = NBRC 102662]
MDPILIVLAGIAVVLFAIIVLRLHAFVALLLAALVTGLLTSELHIFEFAVQKGLSEGEARAMAGQAIGKRLALAFGNTAGKIGILIALASIIGVSLMRSGGAERIIRGLLKLSGKKNTSFAFLSGSFTLAIPVFFDTVFYLMIPLVKSISIRQPKKFSLYLMTIIAGGVMAHSLIPPTPGPLFVAEELGIDLGIMIVGGLVIGAITVLSGYAYALWANKKWELPMCDTPDISTEELRSLSEQEPAVLPSIWISLLPIVLPILLITGNTFLNMTLGKQGDTLEPFQQSLLSVFSVLGESNMALLIAALIAMYLLWTRIRDVALFKKYLSDSIMSAGLIILITSAGGAFGQMLQQTNIGARVGVLADTYQMAILPLAFFITAVVRTAQGSATVAMVTAIGVMSAFSEASGLAFHPVYLALVIGCGSKVFAWMNDSAFWIITQMSGMKEKETIRFFSFLLLVMAFAGLISIMILAWLFPFV